MFTLNDIWKQRTDRLTAFVPFIVCYLFSVVVPFIVYAFSGPKSLCINANYESTLSMLDYFYYSVVTLTTLGYGDIYPCSDLTKWAVIFQAIAGPALIGIFLVAIANDINKRREEQQHNIREREKQEKLREVFSESQLFFRTTYSTCIDFLNEFDSEYKCIKKKSICFASTENWWSSIETVHHNKILTENYMEVFLITLRHHISTMPSCTVSHLNDLETVRKDFIYSIERVIFSVPKSHVVATDYLPSILSIINSSKKMVGQLAYIRNNAYTSKETKAVIEDYLDRYWYFFINILNLIDILNASPATTIIDPDTEDHQHPFGNVEIEKYIHHKWKLDKGISFYRSLGFDYLGRSKQYFFK